MISIMNKKIKAGLFIFLRIYFLLNLTFLAEISWAQTPYNLDKAIYDIDSQLKESLQSRAAKSSNRSQPSCFRLREIFNNRNKLNHEELIKKRHQLFNAIKTTASLSLDDVQSYSQNDTYEELGLISLSLANDQKMPEKVRREAMLTYAFLAAQKGDIAGTVKIFDELVSRHPQDRESISYYFLVLAKAGSQENWKKRSEDFAKQQISQQTHGYAKMPSLYQALVDRIPDSELLAECRTQRAWEYMNDNQIDLAIEEYKAILLMKNIPEYWYAYSRSNLGDYYTLKEDHQAAGEWYHSITTALPELTGWHPLALVREAETLVRLGKKEKAKQIYEKVLKFYPQSPWVGTAQADLADLK